MTGRIQALVNVPLAMHPSVAMRGWVYINFVEFVKFSGRNEYNWMKYVDLKRDITSVPEST